MIVFLSCGFIFYLFPGSILGKIIYGDFKRQPQLTNDFSFGILDISSNHTYIFAVFSFFGLYIYFQKYLKLITIYLIFISVVLEILHLIIPVSYTHLRAHETR